MTLKRRGFLSMLGGAFAVPLLPSMSLGAVTKAAYPASAFHAAIYHAQTRVNFSVFALAQRLNLDLGQAEAIMTDMSKRGILGPLQGSTQAGRWARSTVWRHPVPNAAAARKLAQAKRDNAGEQDKTQRPWADMRPFLNHLYDSCCAQGRALHPRCALLAQ